MAKSGKTNSPARASSLMCWPSSWQRPPTTVWWIWSSATPVKSKVRTNLPGQHVQQHINWLQLLASNQAAVLLDLDVTSKADSYHKMVTKQVLKIRCVKSNSLVGNLRPDIQSTERAVKIQQLGSGNEAQDEMMPKTQPSTQHNCWHSPWSLNLSFVYKSVLVVFSIR